MRIAIKQTHNVVGQRNKLNLVCGLEIRLSEFRLNQEKCLVCYRDIDSVLPNILRRDQLKPKGPRDARYSRDCKEEQASDLQQIRPLFRVQGQGGRRYSCYKPQCDKGHQCRPLYV